MSSSADRLGYRPESESTCRSRSRSERLKPRIFIVTSPILVSGAITVPSKRKWSLQRSWRGLKNRTSSPVDGRIEAISLPFRRLQKVQARARLSRSSPPPVLEADNMVYLATEECVVLVNKAVLAQVLSAGDDLGSTFTADRATHASDAGGHEPLRAV